MVFWLNCPLCATCPIHLILLDMMTLIISGEEYRQHGNTSALSCMRGVQHYLLSVTATAHVSLNTLYKLWSSSSCNFLQPHNICYGTERDERKCTWAYSTRQQTILNYALLILRVHTTFGNYFFILSYSSFMVILISFLMLRYLRDWYSSDKQAVPSITSCIC